METPPPSTIFRRRNSTDDGDTSSTPSKLLLSTISTVDFDQISFKSSDSYTSLKDILPLSNSAVNSPTSANHATATSSSISIRNRLVKQAAWAYLQPMSTSPNSSNRNSFRRVWSRFSPVSAFIGFVHRHVMPTLARAFDRLLQVIRVRS